MKETSILLDCGAETFEIVAKKGWSAARIRLRVTGQFHEYIVYDGLSATLTSRHFAGRLELEHVVTDAAPSPLTITCLLTTRSFWLGAQGIGFRTLGCLGFERQVERNRCGCRKVNYPFDGNLEDSIRFPRTSLELRRPDAPVPTAEHERAGIVIGLRITFRSARRCQGDRHFITNIYCDVAEARRKRRRRTRTGVSIT